MWFFHSYVNVPKGTVSCTWGMLGFIVARSFLVQPLPNRAFQHQKLEPAFWIQSNKAGIEASSRQWMISVIPFEIPLYINITAEGFTNISSHQDFWMKNIRKIWRLQLPRPYGTPWDSYFMSIPYQEPDKLLGGKKRQNSCINIINVTYMLPFIVPESFTNWWTLVTLATLAWIDTKSFHLTHLWQLFRHACHAGVGKAQQAPRAVQPVPFQGVLCHHWKIGCLGFFLVFSQGQKNIAMGFFLPRL